MNQYKIGLFGKKEWLSILLDRLIYDKKFIIKFICFNDPCEINSIKHITNLKVDQIFIKHFNKKNVNKIKKYNCDYLISLSYLKIFPKMFINQFNKNTLINFHSSLLPAYRGRSILNWQIINKEKKSGMTSHFINEGVDTGKIICQVKFNINKTDDYLSLFQKSSSCVYKLLNSSIQNIKKKRFPNISNNRKNKYFKKRVPGDEIFVPRKMTYQNLDFFIRALRHPGPYATIIINEKKYKIYSLEKINIKYSLSQDLKIENGFIITKLKDTFCKLFYLNEKISK